MNWLTLKFDSSQDALYTKKERASAVSVNITIVDHADISISEI